MASDPRPGSTSPTSSSGTHSSMSPRISRIYSTSQLPPGLPIHHAAPPQYLSMNEQFYNMNPQSVISSSLPPVHSIAPTAEAAAVITNGVINGTLPLTLGIAARGGSIPLVSAEAANPPAGTILSAASPANSVTTVDSVGVSTLVGNTGVAALPYGLIMGSGEVDELVGNGPGHITRVNSTVSIGSDYTAENGVENGNGTPVMNGKEEDYEGMGDRFGSGRSSSQTTIVRNMPSPGSDGERFDQSVDTGKCLTSTEPGPDDHNRQVGAWTNLRLVYAINHLRVYRAITIATNKAVVLKLCEVNHLETLARLRHEWKLVSESSASSLFSSLHSQPSSQGTNNSSLSLSQQQTMHLPSSLALIPGVIRPISWDYLPDGGMVLVYDDEAGHETVREKFLPDTKSFNPMSGDSYNGSAPRQPLPHAAVKGRTQMELIKILTVVSSITQVLITAHRLGITHNNINPFSILVTKLGKGRLGGWHLASRLEREDPGRNTGSSLLKENPAPLQYIAPECTGRMNRSVDYRADFYSLGITLYELCVGFLPFRSTDPLELIHQHIAQQPTPPAEINPTIPPALSHVIMKLLMKNAEDRYQAAAGLKADLDVLTKRLTMGETLEGTKVGELDNTSQFVITEKLYGREADVKLLEDAYERVTRDSGSSVVVVSGSSGVGKSRLVNEIQKKVVENKGYFTTSKFDQYKRGFSFFTLVQTLQDLVRQVLSESAISLTKWRAEIARVFDGDAGVLVDVIPEMKLLLGANYQYDPILNLGPTERENRFKSVFAKFLAVFARRGLVMFLDDLQWCSGSEVNLINSVIKEAARSAGGPGGGQKILLIGAYREGDVDDNHPLPAMLDYLRSEQVLGPIPRIGGGMARPGDAKVEVIDIELRPLDQDSVGRIIGDTLHRSPHLVNSNAPQAEPDMQTLTELVYAKTGGNAFFVTQLLRSLHRDGHIVFDFDARKWRFSLSGVEAEGLPPTVVDLLVRQMRMLDEETRSEMVIASCLGGNRIGLDILSWACGKEVEECAEGLWGALEAGLILPTSSNYRVPLVFDGKGLDNTPSHTPRQSAPGSYFPAGILPGVEEESTIVTYRFLHDRVQQAAYSLIPPAERPRMHRMIGERLLEKVAEKDFDGILYEIVNQLNHWLSPLSKAEKTRLMELNLKAGKKAMLATAFGAALEYFQVAKKLLDGPEEEEAKNGESGRPNGVLVHSFRSPPIEAMALEVNLSLVEGYFAQYNYEESIQLVEMILPRCIRPKDRVRCLIQKMNCLLAQGKLKETIVTGLLALSSLGWEVPIDDDEARLHAAMMRPRILLDVPQIRAIAKMQPLREENLILLQDIISILLLPIYMARPGLLPSVCFTSVAISLEYGVSTAGAYAMLMSGVILGAEGTQENLLRSYAFGRLAINLIEKEKSTPPSAPAIYEVYAGHIGVFHQNMSEVLRYLQQAVNTGMVVFNVDYTCFALAEIPVFGLFSGEPLGSVHSKMLLAKPSIRKYKQDFGQWWLDMPLQFVLNLRQQGKSDVLEFEGDLLGTNEDIDRIISGESMSHGYLFSMLRIVIATIFNRYEAAADFATNYCEPLNEAMIGTFYCSLVEFYSAVAFLDIGIENLTNQQKAMLERNIKDMREWSINAKGTFMHKSVLLEAELMRDANENHIKILDKYEEAIALANKVSFMHDAALINERCGLWLSKFSKKRSVPYFREAYRLYATWGAQAKVMELKRWYPDDLYGKDIRPAMSRGDSESITLTSNGGMTIMNNNNNVPSPRPSPRSSRIFAHDYGFDQHNFHQSPSLSGSREIYANEPHDDSASQDSSNLKNESSSLGSELDFRTVLKASLVISEGIHLEEVIVKLMKSVLQTAGADYGVLILKEESSLHIETVGLIDEVTILEHEPLLRRPDLVPISIVNIVANLGEQILRDSDDTKFDTTYGRDSYFTNRKAKSVLCMPIQNQLKTMGVLYLENTLVNHAFTRQRQELLNLLCTQAAVTIDKARLYRQMELAKRAAEEATAEKSTFLANMSHEIRTPFNALLSCSIFLLDTDLSQQQREYVETIKNSAILTLQIIDGILDFSKIEHGVIELQIYPFSLRDCIESALQLVAEPAATKNLELAYSNRCPHINMVYGDITRFRQCVINLIGNSVKFTQSGHILVTTKADRVPESDKWQIQVSVEDTGIGIPEQGFSKLFRAFSQVDSSARRIYGGTGLGLAISKKLAEMMGGDIWFDSKEGQGSTFYLTITAEALEKKIEPDKRLKGKRIVVADTHPISSSIMCKELEVEGLTTTRTSSIDATMKAIYDFGKGKVDFVFIDISIDKTCKICDRIADFDSAIKIIVMSGFGASLVTAEHSKHIARTFVRPAPRSRYVQALLEVIDKKNRKPPELDSLKMLATHYPLKILLAEDNPLNTKVALLHLKRMGYSAEHARDGIEALERCETAVDNGEQFDVILMDVQMPRADGIETSHEIYRRYPDAKNRPAIIALTANATAGDKEKCMDAGMESHIAKPILPDDLARALKSVVPLKNKT